MELSVSVHLPSKSIPIRALSPPPLPHTIFLCAFRPVRITPLPPKSHIFPAPLEEKKKGKKKKES